ncbi:hypothetical protein MBLNU457_1638t1 [Dothideomycetes sp. NU457]
MAPANPPEYAYCTLITRSSYLAGVIILAQTLVTYGCKHPLIVVYTDGLSSDAVAALEAESTKLNLIPRRTDALLPRKNIHVHLIAERFADTWTKLRVFQLHESDTQFKTLCYLDADMIVKQSMDHIFKAAALPGDDWIAANHACVCNLDKDPWAPEDWTKENCAYTAVSHPGALTDPTPVTPSSRPTYHLLNSGMFVFRPSAELWTSMLQFFNTTPLLSEFKFPDQDFLAEFFKNKWMSVGWQFNALKTMRYWHENIWRDDEVVCLHYIVDKPWAKRVAQDGTAGYLKRDGVTHTWWWDEYTQWHDQRVKEAETDKEVEKTVLTMEYYTDSGKLRDTPDMQALGAQVQAFATNKKPGQAADGAGSEDKSEEINEGQEDQAIGSTQTRRHVLGERGHGARLRGGSSHMQP